MTDSKLPTVKNEPLPQASESQLPTSSHSTRLNRSLALLGAGASIGAIAVFTLTHFIFLSVLLATAGLALFVARAWVRKSLALTAKTASAPFHSVDEQLEWVRKQVSKAKYLENVEALGTQAAHQAEQLLGQYKNLKTALARKLSPSELTFQRYQDGINAACLAVGENLVHIMNALENLNLTSKNSLTEAQKQPVVELLETTGAALKQLAQLFHSINEMNTQEKHRGDLEISLERIQELAQRAKIYSKK